VRKIFNLYASADHSNRTKHGGRASVGRFERTSYADRANRVRLLINTAFDYNYGWSEREAEGPGAEVANRLGSGGAGI
jgi:hypothetical protein